MPLATSLAYLDIYKPANCSFFRTSDNKKRGKYSKSVIITSLEFHLSFSFLFFFLQHIKFINAVYIQRGNVLPLRQLMPLFYRSNFLSNVHHVQNHYMPSLFPPVVSYTLINNPPTSPPSMISVSYAIRRLEIKIARLSRY